MQDNHMYSISRHRLQRTLHAAKLAPSRCKVMEERLYLFTEEIGQKAQALWKWLCQSGGSCTVCRGLEYCLAETHWVKNVFRLLVVALSSNENIPQKTYTREAKQQCKAIYVVVG